MTKELNMHLERFVVSRAVWLGLLGVLGCATGPETQAGARPRIADVNVTGGVGQGWVSFDDQHLWAPFAQVSRRQDGSWAGKLAGRIVDAHMEGNDVVIGRSLRANVQPVPQGYLVTYRGIDKELVVSCAPGDKACADAASRPSALDQCQAYGCTRVTYQYVYTVPAQTPVAQIALALLPRNAGW